MINEIKGNNIILREQKIEDVKFFIYWYNQPLKKHLVSTIAMWAVSAS